MTTQQTPDSIGIWYMHDNHTFTKLYGKTLKAVLKRADEVEAKSSYGMLCPVYVLQGKQGLRRVGPCVHAGSSKDTKDKWNAGKAAWKAAMKADADVMRLLPFNAGLTGTQRDDKPTTERRNH